MTMAWIIHTSLYLLSVFRVTVTFNIDPVAWKYISVPAAGFGYKVIQLNSTSLLISAPEEQYENSRRGKVYECRVGVLPCTPLPIQVPSDAVNMSLGLSMTKDPKTSKTLVCGPTIPRDCKTITTYNGMCLEIDSDLATESLIPSSLEDCPGGTNIAFLLDGSASVADDDFKIMKTFVKNLITQFLERNTKFAIIQFSDDSEIHMSFNVFKNNTESWQLKLEGISQHNELTYTATAIKRIVKDVFIPSQGSRPKAKKVLIVVTDGASTDRKDLKSAIEEAEKAEINRFAIGVGTAFDVDEAKDELTSIASSPQSNHMFKVDSFQALDQIRNSLQNSIFPIEGSTGNTTEEGITMEMAQEGFSAAYIPGGGFQIASVGAFQWRGAYQEYTRSSQNPTPQQSQNMEPDSYMGYSMAVAKTSTRQFSIIGAPRFKHTGRVDVFSPGASYDPIEFSGQIGAYFGSEICVVDLDKDSYTDHVLISAPMITDRDKEGRVYICTLNDEFGVVCEFNAEMTLQGAAGNIGRFGTSLAPLPDLNMDGFNDLAVGAPLENNGQGSVYIFLGSRIGISNVYSQRISGSDVHSGIKFFGLSISQSSLDMSSDSLPDVAVGSKGAVLLLRSRPIVTVRTEVTFNPTKISTDTSNSSMPRNHTATVCFIMTEITADTTKVGQARINYTLTLDVTRQAPNYRAYYNRQDKIRKNTENAYLTFGKQCFEEIFLIMDEPDDALNELSNELSFTFEGLPSSAGPRASLSPQSQTTTYHELGFEIKCGTDDNCIDNLKVDFNFTGSSEMKVGIDDVLNVTVSVENRGENSYNSRVILTYPAGLSFRRFTALQGRVECDSIDSEHGVTRGKSDCTINKPIFKSNSKAFFIISYGIDSKSQFDQIVTITANASSGNNEHAPTSELYSVKDISVKYSIYVLITRHEDSTMYINFKAGTNDMQKHVKQKFVVVNYVRDFNFTVIIKVPMKLGDKYIWADQNNLLIPGCHRDKDEKPLATDFEDKLKKNTAVDCFVAMCEVFLCNVSMKKEQSITYNIAGNISSAWIEQIEFSQFSLVSTATLDYDRNQYAYFSSDSKYNPPIQTIETEVELYLEVNFTKEIIGGGFGGFLLCALMTAGMIKAGFFKSQFKQMGQDTLADEPGDDNDESIPAE